MNRYFFFFIVVIVKNPCHRVVFVFGVLARFFVRAITLLILGKKIGTCSDNEVEAQVQLTAAVSPLISMNRNKL